MVTTSRHTKKENAKSATASVQKAKAVLALIDKHFPATTLPCVEDLKKASSVSSDAVNHPAHYNAGKFEVIDVIEDWQLGFHLGNVVKYIARSPHKGQQLDDLKKALWYLQRKITTMEK